MLLKDFARLNRSSQNSICAALIIIAGVGMYKWIFSPHTTYLLAAQQNDYAMRKIVDKNITITREIEGKTKELDELSRQLADARIKLFTPEQAKEFFKNLRTIFHETGCKVHSMNLVVDESRDKKKQPEINSGAVANSANLSVSGQYNSMIKLIEGLQNNTSKVFLDSFLMELLDFESGRLKCDMTVTIYIIQDKEADL